MAGIHRYLEDLGELVVQEKKEILVVRSPTVDLLCKRFEEFLSQSEKMLGVRFSIDDEYDEIYTSALNYIRGAKYSSKDINVFSIKIKEYESEPNFVRVVGAFISVLIDNSEENSFEVVTEHLTRKMLSLGYLNKKRLIVNGDLGVYTGLCMKQGQLIINGNTGYYLGFMACGGEIYVNGEIEKISANCKAKIYQRGKQVWPR